MEISFYQLKTSLLEKALPRLLEKAYDAGHRVHVLADEKHIKILDDTLWTYSTNKFLPHGTKAPEKQPIFISASPANQNNASVIAITNGASPNNLSDFGKVLDIFDGNYPEQLESARERWKIYKSQNFSMRYWLQDEKGMWIEKT